jgi:hypothetical protein
MPSPWVTRFAGLIPPGPVLDLAAGAGRHARYLLERGPRRHVRRARRRGASPTSPAAPEYEIVRRRPRGRRRMAAGRAPSLRRDRGDQLPPSTRSFPRSSGAHRAGRRADLRDFRGGPGALRRPTNPDFLLRRGELLEVARGLTVLAYEDLEVEEPARKRVQRICAHA